LAGALTIDRVTRRIHLGTALRSGACALDAAQAHHVRDVLRLGVGHVIEVFDDAGNFAQAIIETCDARNVSVRIDAIEPKRESATIVIASAIPKGDRADWMVEKLSELGVAWFIPLKTARSVVHPKGGKLDRWRRIATESAKQSRRAGVMQIDDLTEFAKIIGARSASPRRREGGAALYLSTDPQAAPILHLLSSFIPPPSSLSFFIGPEGGWTDDEINLFHSQGLTGVKLTETILRVETAALAAAVIACVGATVESKSK
jgi:16S rRNA (uracil1498-N3)-methyltransferase